jgi:hypothetical protein
VYLTAGTALDITPADHLGDDHVHLLISRVVGVTADHVMIEGMQKPTPTTPWRERRIFLCRRSVKRCLVIILS